MRVYFEKTIAPCVCDDVIAWHISHGWVWNVSCDGKYIAVFFATLINGDGCIVHFTTRKDVEIPPAALLKAFRKGVKMVAFLPVVYATIPEEKSKLISIAKRLGFGETNAGFDRPECGPVAMLKYLKSENVKL